MLDFHIARNQTEKNHAYKIREQVFVIEQQVSPELERDGLDDSVEYATEHIVAYHEKRPVGTARILFKDNRAKLGRIAIIKEKRSKGLGTNLMEFLIKYLKEKKVNEIYMHAQYYLFNFYQKFGFKQRGNIFYEANIKHIEMFLDF